MNLFHEQCCGLCKHLGYPTTYRGTKKICHESRSGWWGAPKQDFEGVECRFFVAREEQS